MTRDTAPRVDSALARHVGELSRCSGTLLGMADAIKAGNQPNALNRRIVEMLLDTSARIQGTVDELMEEASHVASE